MRSVGHSVSYSSEATVRYISQWQRWNRGRYLSGNLVSLNGSVAYVRYPSSRSPSGFWETLVDLGGTATTPGGGYGDPACWSDEALPDGGDLCRQRFYRHFGWLAYPNDLGGGYYANGGNSPTWVYGLPSGSYALNSAGSSNEGDWRVNYYYYVPHGAPSDEEVLTYFVEHWSDVFNYSEGLRDPPFDIPPDQIPNALELACGLNYGNQYNPLCSGSGGGGGGGGSGGSCGNSLGVCTCPDYLRTHGPLPVGYPSEERLRSWLDTNAEGAHAQSPYWCKHIYKTVIDFCAAGNAAAVEPTQARQHDDNRYGMEEDGLDLNQWRRDRYQDRRDARRNAASDFHNFRQPHIDRQVRDTRIEQQQEQRDVEQFERRLESRYGSDFAFSDLSDADQQMAREYGLDIYGAY